MLVLGIDPGINGAVAVFGNVEPEGKITHDVLDIPVSGDGASRRINAAALFDWIVKHKPDHAYIENVASMPEQGIASAFRFGRAAGSLEATVACARVPFTLVVPRVWKKFYGLKGPDKEQSRQRAINLMPTAVSSMPLKQDHQRAEALLIARYGYMVLAGRATLPPEATAVAAPSEEDRRRFEEDRRLQELADAEFFFGR